ncbi:MAG: SHOCT domain-containing protein [Gammaproteobacteria bacterium]|nr:SHOCT domain-containing protein [Gammaproteobacteria bacterium]
MRLEAARMKKEQRELKLEMARMREQMKSLGEGGGGEAGAAGGKTVEERMATLDKLREEGLISDEEYAAKREEILGDI